MWVGDSEAGMWMGVMGAWMWVGDMRGLDVGRRQRGWDVDGDLNVGESYGG